MSHAAPEHVMDWAEWELTKAKAATLAATMTAALNDPHNDTLTVCCGEDIAWHPVTSDLVEWCRSARDILGAVAHG